MGDFWSRREESRATLVRFLAAQGPLALLVDTVGNTGDMLIREGTRQMLSAAGLACEEETAELTLAESAAKTLLVRGSGGFDRLFNKFMPDVVLRASRLYRRVVILPSSFDPREPVVKRCLVEGNVVAIAREMLSYDAIRSYGREFVSMDCALYHRRFTPEAALPASTGAVSGQEMLLVLRRDKGSPLESLGLEPNAALNDDISLSVPAVDEWLGRIALATTVVTDRLHVAVAAVLLGRKLVMIDPYDSKLSAYAAFAFAGDFADRIERQGVPWLVSHGLAVPSRQR